MAEVATPTPQPHPLRSPVVLFEDVQYGGQYHTFKAGGELDPEDYVTTPVVEEVGDSGHHRFFFGSAAIHAGWELRYGKDVLEPTAGALTGTVPIMPKSEFGTREFRKIRIVRKELGDRILENYQQEHDASRIPDEIPYLGPNAATAIANQFLPWGLLLAPVAYYYLHE